MKNKLLLLFITLLIMQNLFAQVELVEERFSFDPDLSYNLAIPSPERFLGYELGESLTLYQDMVAYVNALADADKGQRMQLRSYGKTYEGRTLYHALISSPANMARIDDLLARHQSLMDQRVENTEEILNNDPVFVSFSYNIHGNETSSTEAAMQVAYRLVAGQDAETLDMLNKAVVSIYFCINPDGRDRYVYWYKGSKRQVVGKEPKDLEHYAPWPNGRTNHYWFDLNRDWIWGVHPESRGHARVYQEVMPNVHVDYHEMGYDNNYFTTPGTTPRNILLPERYEAWADTFGRANVAFFDENQLNYFTREAFDFFYPGYGSSYPSVMGAIGMLTEQGGIGGGRAVTTEDGYVLTLRQRIFDHYHTTLATLRKSTEHRKDLLAYSKEAMNPANNKNAVKAYYLPADQDNFYVEDVVDILIRHGVKVYQTRDTIQRSVISYWDDQVKNRTFLPGSYFIPTDQARYLFLHTLMDRQMAIEDSVMYDMATWSAPLAYNLEAYYSKRMDKPASLSPVVRSAKKGTPIANASPKYAYVIPWNQRNAPKALAKLWEKEYRVRLALEPFGNGKQKFGYGTLIILKGRNRERAATIEADMKAIADATGVEIIGLNSGRMLDGNDLASRKSVPLKQPKVALMVEPPFSTYTTGQLYFLFDQDTELPVERIRTSILKQTAFPKFGQRYGLADLNDYDVLILAGGGNHLDELFDKKYLAELEAWIKAGGTLVATEDAAEFFTAEASKLTKVKLHKLPKDSSEAAKFLPFEDRTDYFGKKRIPGSALKAKVDVSNPLAFGLQPQLYSLKFGAEALVPDASLQTVGYYLKDPDALLASGYSNAENLKHLSGNTFAAVLPMGEGRIVFLLDNTQYRMFWRGPSRMMQNAVMLLPSIN